jgi:citrate lyase subunit beta/citryl-CoA lyase
MIEKAYENRDLLALEKLAKPTKRVLNKRDDFSSVLMLSANNIKHLKKIADIKADCIILNLEDGVSKENKPTAMRLCAYILSHHLTCKKKLVVRVNALDEGGDKEIRYLSPFMPDAFRVPKIRSKEDVQKALSLIKGESELHLSIETKESWLRLQDLAVDKRVTAFYLGVLDLLADMKLPQSLINTDNPTMHYILTHFLITCKAMGVKPVSFVFQDYKDTATFKQWLKIEREMGYDAKGCLSPSQVSEVDKIFSMDEKEIEDAKNIIKLFEAKRAEGITGFSDERYGFIDEPIYKGAKALLGIL